MTESKFPPRVWVDTTAFESSGGNATWAFKDGYFTKEIPTSVTPYISMIEHEAIVAPLVSALKQTHAELACLVPNPKDVKLGNWPCNNSADRECLNNAYLYTSDALKTVEAK